MPRPLSHLGALGTRHNTLPVHCGRTCQTALVYLEVGGSKQAYVRRDAVANGEDDKVASGSLYFIYYLLQISIVRT